MTSKRFLLTRGLFFMVSSAQDKYFKFAFALWIYTLIVILWGAWVRISHSGDGCGQSWPLCHGQLLPSPQNTPTGLDTSTWIELSHRISTGVLGIAVVALVVMAFWFFPKAHRVRKASLWTLFFTLTEALIGAKLVLSGLVGDVHTFDRVFVMSFHQVNSFLLMGSLVMSFKSPVFPTIKPDSTYHYQPTKLRVLVSAVFLQLNFLVVAASGAIAALSSTLWISESLLEGLKMDFQAGGPWLARWRIVHPIFSALYVLAGVLMVSSLQDTNPHKSKNEFYLLMGLYVMAFLIGSFNLLTLSPVPLKLIHLICNHVLWAYLIYFFYLILPEKYADDV